ncbi:MAG: hypothetical protein ABIG96_00475 [Candidatus Micrarchaeota archaeon]
MGSPEFLIPWVVLGIWFAIFSWLGTGTMLEKWGRKKGFEKLVKRESSRVMMLSVLNSFVEAFFVFMMFIIVYAGMNLDFSTYYIFFALLGIIAQIPVRVGLALSMNLPERFLLGDMVGGIFKYIIGAWLMLTFAPAGL